MHGNRQAYKAAYERALAGKSTRTLLDILTWPFEDNYTRQSREEGARDGAAARLTQGAAQTSSAPPAQH